MNGIHAACDHKCIRFSKFAKGFEEYALHQDRTQQHTNRLLINIECGATGIYFVDRT